MSLTSTSVRPDRRRGASLFELMAAMSAASVVIATSTTLVHRTFTIESRSRAVIADERTALRLARQFRTDIHEAATVLVSGGTPDTPLVEFTVAEGSVVYRATDTGLLRIAASDSAETAREGFSFTKPVAWHATRDGRLVTLSGSAAADASPRPKLAIDIVAAAGPNAVAPPAPGGSP
jgi:Tfp pilus assembly protein PilW